MRPIIFPHNIGSAGARELARQLDTIRVRANGTYRPTERHCVINWGNSAPPPWVRRTRRVGEVYGIANQYGAVAVASDKLRTFEAFRQHGVPHPEWTTDRAEAGGFFNTRDAKVVCRQLLRASEGRGIVVARNAGELVAAPLYVRFFPKQTEYRVHVFQGGVIDVTQKRLRNGERERPDRNPYIRSHANGWVFTHENVRLPDAARDAALRAVTGVGLTFGAVDLAVNQRGDIAVFEVNTAPGIEGQTVTRYADAIRRYCNA